MKKKKISFPDKIPENKSSDKKDTDALPVCPTPQNQTDSTGDCKPYGLLYDERRF